MSKFEEIGVSYQYNANTVNAAKRSFECSCERCCTKGMRLECARCAIAVAHDIVVALLNK